MTKRIDVITFITESTGFSRAQVSSTLDALQIKTLTDLRDEGEALLPGLGKIKVRTRPARQGRNPRTGEPLDIPSKNVAKFSAGIVVRETIND